MKFKLVIAIGLLTGALLYSCRPEKFKDLGIPENVLRNLAGTWKVTKVIQTDEDAKRKGFPYKDLDLTKEFPYTDFVLTLNFNGDVPSTFATVPGSSPKIIKLLNGNWKVDDPVYPKIITMYKDRDTARVTLGSYPTLANPHLKITVNRLDAATGKLLLSYSYEFTKQ